MLGMHRSGTSALTGVVSMCGVYPGDSLLSPMEGVNPKGFWEHAEIVAVHEELLAALDSRWDDERNLPSNWQFSDKVSEFKQRLRTIVEREFVDCPIWILKDPRLCRLLPLWLELFGELDVSPRFILCLRHPGQVAASLRRRDSIPEERAALLWLQYVLESERITRTSQRAIVTYEGLLRDWRGTVESVFAELSLETSVADCKHESIERFLDPALQHNAAESRFHNETRVSILASTVYEAMMSGQMGRIPSAYDEIKRIADSVSPWARQIREMQLYIERRNREYRDLELSIERVKSTFSWKLTRPIRAFHGLLRSITSWCTTDKAD